MSMFLEFYVIFVLKMYENTIFVYFTGSCVNWRRLQKWKSSETIFSIAVMFWWYKQELANIRLQIVINFMFVIKQFLHETVDFHGLSSAPALSCLIFAILCKTSSNLVTSFRLVLLVREGILIGHSESSSSSISSKTWKLHTYIKRQINLVSYVHQCAIATIK